MKNIQVRKRNILALIITVLIVTISFLVYGFVKQYNEVQKNNIESMENFVDKTSEAISNDFVNISKLIDDYSLELSNNQYSAKELKTIVQDLLEQNEKIQGIAIAYEPYMFDSSIKLFAPYCSRSNGEINVVQVEDFYDYTNASTSGYNWYVLPVQNGKGWSEPYYGSASEELLSVYSAPFYDYNDSTKIAGVITAAYSLDQINNILASYAYDGSSYSYMYSQNGKLMVYPIDEYVKEGKTIYDITTLSSTVNNDEIIEAFNSDEKYSIETIDKITNTSSLSYYTIVEGTNFTIVNSFQKDSLLNGINFKGRLIILVILTVITLIFITLLICNLKDSKNILKITIIISLLFLIAIIAILWISGAFTEERNSKFIKIDTMESLNSFLNEEQEECALNYIEPPVIIPTGLFIQSMEFENSNNVTLTGFLWQKYTDDQLESCEPGFIFPEAISFGSEQAYERKSEGQTTIGWYFETTLRQTFDYSKYPFDSKNVWIRIWHKEFDKNIILKPSIDDYALYHDDALPGIENAIVLSGWNIEKTFFSYTNNSYNTNFGISDYIGTSDFPELYYTIMISREILNPFISDFLPIFVILALLFAVLVLTSQNDEISDKLGVSLSEAIGTCSALFFAVVLSHSSLRDRIPTDNILYMEYLYIIAYIGIMFVVVDAFAVNYKKKWKIISYKDNLIPKLLFWPVVLLLMLIFTIKAFCI